MPLNRSGHRRVRHTAYAETTLFQRPSGAEKSTTWPAGVAQPGERETILLVEDDDAIRRVGTTMLAAHGYRVYSAPDAGIALDLSGGHHGPIHLVITDVILPGMSGPQLVERLRRNRPELRTLFISGHERSEVLTRIEASQADFIQKPFTLTALLAAVRGILDREISSNA